MADDLVAGGVEDRSLPLDDRDERILAISDAIEHIPHVRGALLAELGEASRAATRTASDSVAAC